MTSLILQDRRHSRRLPVTLTVLGQIEGRDLPMCTENISRDGMFLFSREFIRPGSIFPARVWLAADTEPLQTYLASIFTESRWTGYGIGVHLSGISAADKTRWESFYQRSAPAGSTELHPRHQADPTPRTQRVVVVEGALDRLAMQELRKQGLEVSQVQSVVEALEAFAPGADRRSY